MLQREVPPYFLRVFANHMNVTKELRMKKGYQFLSTLVLLHPNNAISKELYAQGGACHSYHSIK